MHSVVLEDQFVDCPDFEQEDIQKWKHDKFIEMCEAERENLEQKQAL